MAATDALLEAVMLSDATWLTVARTAIVLDAETENAASEMRMALADAVLLLETATAPLTTARTINDGDVLRIPIGDLDISLT